MTEAAPNPAQLVEHDPAWAAQAARLLAAVREALHGVLGSETAAYDHIGSTSVPGLMAKPFVDLQVRILPLPTHEQLGASLAPLGFDRALGARPDSKGVTRDVPPAGSEDVPDEVWEKRLYVHRKDSIILHIRRADSPWGRHTVWFRDWLREHPEGRARYEATKQACSLANAGKPDYDDYTLGKSDFFREVHQTFVEWGQSRG